MRLVASLLLYLAALLTLKAQSTISPLIATNLPSTSPKYEVRAVWLTTLNGLDWPRTKGKEAQQKELINLLDRLHQAGINTVLFQTRVRATTMYPSKIEPWDPVLAGGNDPGYDPLQLCVDECHKRGMECHAWVCTIPIGKWNRLGSKEFKKKQPRLVKRIGDETYMDPENPLTADYLARICREIVANYDVDGIHLDYIRYPETWKQKVVKAKGRDHITRIVRAISKAVKDEKPWVKMSCSPVGKYDDLTRYRSGGWNARTAVCQDAQLWLREGLMDQLYPMMYFQGNHFYPFALDWQEKSSGRTVVPGLGTYFLDPAEGKWTADVVEREMSVCRQIGMGHCHFRAKFFLDNVKGIYDFTKNFDCLPALVPPMTWMKVAAPAAPDSLAVSGNVISWKKASTGSDDSLHLFYNIYASREYPVDVNRAENIVATRITGTQALVPQNGMSYAVTAMNRYGMESEPAQLQLFFNMLKLAEPRKESVVGSMPVIVTDGYTLAIPPKPSTLDADFIVVETIQGKQVAVTPYAANLDIKALPDGLYQLRSLGRKGRNHRLALFRIKRQ